MHTVFISDVIYVVAAAAQFSSTAIPPHASDSNPKQPSLYTQDALMKTAMDLNISVIPAAWLVKLISYAPQQTSSYCELVVPRVVLHVAMGPKKYMESECTSHAMLPFFVVIWRIRCYCFTLLLLSSWPFFFFSDISAAVVLEGWT